MDFNFGDLTLDEVETMENLIGESLDYAFIEGKPKGKALKVFVWVLTKRSNPDFTIEQASKVSLRDALATFEGADEKKAV